MDKVTLIFEHIPKTAGSTVNSVLQREYKSGIYHIESLNTLGSINAFRSFSKSRKESYSLIRGHGASLLANEVENPLLFTFLRNPAERMLSQYNYLKTRDDHRSAVKARQYSLIDFLKYSKEMGEDNLMTRFLSDKTEATLMGEGEPLQKEDLKIAIERLSQFNRVFLTEHFDASLLELKKWLNWKQYPFYGVENKSVGKQIDSLSETEYNALLECECLDAELYAVAKRQWGSRYEISSQALSRFRFRNQIFNYIRSAYRFLK